MAKLAACLLNISEGRQAALIEQIARSALQRVAPDPESNFQSDCAVLNIFADRIYNRSVISIAGTLEGLTKSVISASRTALDNIDLRQHEGGHPRKGSVDLIPIHPITESTSLIDCGQVAMTIGSQLRDSHPDLEIFYFGHADPPAFRDLVKARKQVGWFQGVTNSPSRHGLTGIGAVPYMSNFNVMLETNDLRTGLSIAASLRERNGGFLGVQCMAFPHENDRVEVACNVDLICYDPKNERHQKAREKGHLVHCMAQYYITSFSTIFERVRALASKSGITVQEKSKIVGFTPNEMGEIATKALQTGDSWQVKPQNMKM